MNIFPRQLNLLPLALAGAAFVGGGVLTFVVWYYLSPKNLQVGYEPEQPVHYSHRLHAGELGMDCRYCHANVERSHEAMVPPTQTCMGCHTLIHPESAQLQPLRDSWETGESVEWVRLHKLPDHTYFDHSTHLYGALARYEGSEGKDAETCLADGTCDRVAIGCESCHGRVDRMDVVRIDQPIAMQWCLECHRDPTEHLRPASAITEMGFEPSVEWLAQADANLAAVNPPTHCSGCHR